MLEIVARMPQMPSRRIFSMLSIEAFQSYIYGYNFELYRYHNIQYGIYRRRFRPHAQAEDETEF